MRRVLPLAAFGYLVATIRLGLDFWDPERAMWFGLYYTMPVALVFVGLTRRWGPIGWRPMALTMLVLGFLVWGVCNSIAYTVGQFLEWTDGRYSPGELVDGTWVETAQKSRRAAEPQATAPGKVMAGLVHGLISSLTSTVWCTAFGTLFLWVPKWTRRERR